MEAILRIILVDRVILRCDMGSDKPDIGYVRMSYFKASRMSIEAGSNIDKKLRGWEALEEKLKAK